MIKLDTILHINRASRTTYKMNSKCSSRGNVQTLIFSRKMSITKRNTHYTVYTDFRLKYRDFKNGSIGRDL